MRHFVKSICMEMDLMTYIIEFLSLQYICTERILLITPKKIHINVVIFFFFNFRLKVFLFKTVIEIRLWC